MTKEAQVQVDAKDEAKGREIAELFDLKPIKGLSPVQFQTTWGTKTYVGLARTVWRIFQETTI